MVEPTGRQWFLTASLVCQKLEVNDDHDSRDGAYWADAAYHGAWLTRGSSDDNGKSKVKS